MRVVFRQVHESYDNGTSRVIAGTRAVVQPRSLFLHLSLPRLSFRCLLLLKLLVFDALASERG